MCFEGLGTLTGDGEGGVGFAAYETFLTLDVAEVFEAAGMGGKVAVGEVEERFKSGEVDGLVDH